MRTHAGGKPFLQDVTLSPIHESKQGGVKFTRYSQSSLRKPPTIPSVAPMSNSMSHASNILAINAKTTASSLNAVKNAEHSRDHYGNKFNNKKKFSITSSRLKTNHSPRASDFSSQYHQVY